MSFYKLADLPARTANLWPLEGGQILLESKGTSFTLVQNDRLSSMDELGEGLPPTSSDPEGTVRTILGRWPDAVWLVWRAVDRWSRPHDMYYDRVFRLRGDRWEQVDEAPHDEYINHVYQALWDQGRGCLVGLLADDQSAQNAWVAYQKVLDCKGQTAPHLSFKATVQKEYGVAAARGWPSGDVLVLEVHAAMKEGEPVPARLALSRPGSPNRAEVVLSLPPEIQRGKRRFELHYSHLLGNTPTDVYVIGNHILGEVPRYGPPPGDISWPPLLLHFDGTSVAEMPAPPVEVILDADRGEDGTLVILGKPRGESEAREVQEVWALPRGGAWVRIPMPVDAAVKAAYIPASIAARSLSDIWTVGFHGQHGKDLRVALFRSHRLAEAAPGANTTQR
ncbi:hypothetical protein [Sorangium sp. So ce861]|uniref:hypothetical protein n=1 Tax=Sorangium sp. So ce861 TaxID=3133323 RepID=UPI003F606DD8